MATELVLLGTADARMPDAGALVRATDIRLPARTEGSTQAPVAVLDDGAVRVTAMEVTHGRAAPALAYRFDTADGSVVFSGDTTASGDLIALARGADILVHQVAGLGYLERHGMTGAVPDRMAAPRTDVPGSAASPSAHESASSSSAATFPLIPARSPPRNGPNAPGRASAGRPPRAATACAERSAAAEAPFREEAPPSVPIKNLA